MSLQYSGVGLRINNSFTGEATTTILNGIRTALLAAGWTDLKRHKSYASFINSPFNTVPGNADWVQIGSTVYKFYSGSPAGDGSIPVLIAGAGGSMLNLQAAINANDPLFVSPFGGVYSTAQAFAGVTILSKTYGTATNGTTLSVDSANFGAWFTGPQTSVGIGASGAAGGGWEMQSLATPTGLQMRVRLVGEIAQGGGSIVPNIYVTTMTEDTTSAAFLMTISPVLTYRIICGPYQFAIFAQSSLNAGTALFGGTPYLQSFLQPVVITAVSQTNPIQCTTQTAHGLTTGQTVSITEAKETATVTATGSQPTGIHAGEVLVTANNAFVSGDVVGFGDGTYYSISNAGALSFTLDFSNGAAPPAGSCAGPKHSILGTWTVTAVDAFNVLLNGSVGNTAPPYVVNSGLLAAPGRLGRAIWAIGSNGAKTFRNALVSGGNAQFIALNSASYGQFALDVASPRLVMPGLAAQALNFSNGCAVVTEPLIAAGPNGQGSQAVVFGQLWDAALITAAYTLDLETAFDGHNYHLITPQVGDTNDYQGSLFLAIS